jgi:hypothetical protein
MTVTCNRTARVGVSTFKLCANPQIIKGIK